MSAPALQPSPTRIYREKLDTWAHALAAGTVTPREAITEAHRYGADLRLVQRVLRDMNWPRGFHP